MLRKCPSNACFDSQHYLYLLNIFHHIYGAKHKLERDSNLIESLQTTHPAQANRRGWPHAPPGSTSVVLFEQWCGFFYVPQEQISESAVKRRPTVFRPYPRRLESITVYRCPRLQKQSVFLRIQVRASSQTKGLERG